MDHDDARIDEALEALARPQPPPDHVSRVLARTSAAVPGSSFDAHDVSPRAYLRPRWILPVAATVLAVLGATWQIERQARSAFDDATAPDASTHTSGQPAWGLTEEVVQPVLPPQAYWGMDPFQEFATLRPGTRVTAQALLSPSRAGDSFMRHAVRARQMAADDELPWEAMPTGLPPIELASIVPTPLTAALAAPLVDITPAEIPLAPIVIAPLDDQERP